MDGQRDVGFRGVTHRNSFSARPSLQKEGIMIVLGIILAIVGWVIGLSILLYLGVALIVIGLVLNFVPLGAGGVRRGPVGGRWY